MLKCCELVETIKAKSFHEGVDLLAKEFAELERLRREVERLREELADWKRKFKELTPEDIREMAWERNALLEKEVLGLRALVERFRFAVKVESQHAGDCQCSLCRIIRVSPQQALAIEERLEAGKCIDVNDIGKYMPKCRKCGAELMPGLCVSCDEPQPPAEEPNMLSPIPERLVCNNCAATKAGEECEDCIGNDCACPCNRPEAAPQPPEQTPPSKTFRARSAGITCGYPNDLPRSETVKLLDDLLRYCEKLEHGSLRSYDEGYDAAIEDGSQESPAQTERCPICNGTLDARRHCLDCNPQHKPCEAEPTPQPQPPRCDYEGTLAQCAVAKSKAKPQPMSARIECQICDQSHIPNLEAHKFFEEIYYKEHGDIYGMHDIYTFAAEFAAHLTAEKQEKA